MLRNNPQITNPTLAPKMTTFVKNELLLDLRHDLVIPNNRGMAITPTLSSFSISSIASPLKLLVKVVIVLDPCNIPLLCQLPSNFFSSRQRLTNYEQNSEYIRIVPDTLIVNRIFPSSSAFTASQIVDK
jgi:hypothetical protein